MDESIMSVPFLQLGVLVPCSNCGEKVADVYAVDEEAALAGLGVCRRCAAMAGRPVEPLVPPEGEVENTAGISAAEEPSESGAPVQVEESEAEVAEKIGSDKPLTAAEGSVPVAETVRSPQRPQSKKRLPSRRAR
jgi:hypothetical protein